jgi:GDP-mannose 6-dehydrogenase
MIDVRSIRMAISKALRLAPALDPASAVRELKAATARPEPRAILPTLSVIGLGYVGVVSVGCLAGRGFHVVGVDLDPVKVDAVAKGQAPIVERGLGELLAEGVRDGRILASRDVTASVAATDVTLLSVGTPTSADGGCDLTYVRAASRSIGEALRRKIGYHTIILRCSVPPGTTMDVAVPEIEAASGKKLGVDFGICFSPEFLREGSAVADFDDPPKIVIAANDPRAEAVARQVLALPGQDVLTTTMAAAETLKYVDNVWHATKVVFANEVGRFCKPLGVDSHEVMRLFVEDTKLNLSPYYLKPGFAFGGSCLPKEVRAAMHIGSNNGVSLPMIESLLASNVLQIDEAQQLIEEIGGACVGFLGLAFKPGTDDLRESPMVELMARVVRGGRTVRVADPSLAMGPRLAAQTAAIRKAHPELAPALDAIDGGHILQSTATVMQTCDVLVVAHATDAFRQAVKARRAGLHVVDLARLFPTIPAQATYHGLGW